MTIFNTVCLLRTKKVSKRFCQTLMKYDQLRLWAKKVIFRVIWPLKTPLNHPCDDISLTYRVHKKKSSIFGEIRHPILKMLNEKLRCYAVHKLGVNPIMTIFNTVCLLCTKKVSKRFCQNPMKYDQLCSWAKKVIFRVISPLNKPPPPKSPTHGNFQ